jgi:hypothetical protein
MLTRVRFRSVDIEEKGRTRDLQTLTTLSGATRPQRDRMAPPESLFVSREFVVLLREIWLMFDQAARW